MSVNFESIEDFLDFLPGHERLLVENLREIVLECLPGVKEKLSYGVPYYYGKRRICFIWPSSVTWGNVRKNGVMIGFCYGQLIDDDRTYLDKEGRNTIATRTFIHPDEINENVLRDYLFKAFEIDATLK